MRFIDVDSDNIGFIDRIVSSSRECQCVAALKGPSPEVFGEAVTR